MAEASIACQYFHHLAEYRVAVCKECQYAVWPDQIEGHLHEQHKIQRRDASEIGSEVRRWAGVIQYPSEFVPPSQIVAPHPQLPIYSDGLLCQLNPSQCQRVLRSIKSMKQHWHEDHQGWSAGKKRGRPSRTKAKGLQAQMDQGYTRVHCQRLFGSRHGSQYFQVHGPGDDNPNIVPVDSEAAWAQVGEQMAKVWVTIEKRAQNTIQDGERDEVNPWLERTQWLPYLVGMERPDLLACVEEPVTDPDPRKNEEAEPVEAAIWAAMDGLARFSQASVIDRIGVFVRLEAIRTEKHQTRFQPLQPYMDKDAIVKHVRPWQQMLMFFARTQREHTWKSPQYRFTRRQREAWEALVEETERSVNREEEEPEEDADREMGESDEEIMDEIDEAIETEEEEQDPTEPPQPQPVTPRLSRIQKACLAFCVALLNQSITRKEYDSPLVCALAVLGVKEDGWKGPEQYPPILSAVIKVARFMVVQQALELSGPLDDELDDDSAYESDSSRPHQRRPKGCLQFVQEMMDRFMVRGSHGPMQWMLDLRTYGLKIHYNTTSRGHVEWAGSDELLYKGLQFTMAQFRSMVHGLAFECRRLLIEELMFGDSKAGELIPSVPWESMRDNPTDERPGWNFLKDHRTRMPVDGEKWLFERVGRDANVRERFMKPGTRSGIHRQGVERYMDGVVQFREKMAALMHFVLGQPQRWPELASIRHSNTVKGGLRNMGIEDGMVYVATRYHKGYAISGDVKIIHRYLPREVGELVVWYLWLVLPFQQRLEAMVWEKEAISSHMWPADPNGRKWTSERFREALKRESRIGLGQELTIASYREIAIGISRRFLRRSTAFTAEEGDENEEWNEENRESLIADEQAGHTAHIAGMIYARGVMEQAGVVAEKRQQFRASSIEWHRFLGFRDAENDVKSSRKRKRAPFENEADEARMDRCGRLRKMDTTAQLKRMMSKTAEFRGVQQEAIDAIVAGESPVVAVMPTGGGKSLLFMLPAWAEQGGTTVVVIPLIALRGDMMQRCKSLGILCAAWEGRRPPDAAAVVLVTPESAVGEEFATFLNRLRATRQLDRIVIDECHIVLNQRYTFRKQMQQLGKLVAAETQMVLLTATLPPSEEDELFRRMHFERDQVKMFRAKTTRTNVAYRVIQVDETAKQEEVEAVAVRIARRKLRKYRVGKIVIYGNSVSGVKRLAEKLGCNAYFHDAVGKASMLADFMADKQRVIVATSALGMGVDIPDIRCIIHIHWPWTILDYAQESGRAGRDGLRSEAIIIGQDREQAGCRDKQTASEQRLVQLYAKGDGITVGCRRRVLDGYLDGRKDREGCEEGEERCDICRVGDEEMDEDDNEDHEDSREDDEEEEDRGDGEKEREETQQAFQQQEQERQGPRQRFMQQRQQEFADVEWLGRQLAWWAKRCGICEAVGEGGSEHDVRRCWRQESRDIQEAIKSVEEQIKYERYSGCFWCGVPQEICNRWERNSHGRYQRTKEGDCQYRGVLIGGLLGVAWGYAGVGERWKARLEGFGVDGSEAGQTLVEFLGKKQVLETVESNHLVGEFCWITGLIAG
jgi:superfamily II DNA helicase RecQ